MKLKSIALILMTVALPAMAEKVSVNTKGMSLILDVENGKPAQYLYFGTKLNPNDLQNLKVATDGRMDAYPAYGLNTPAEAALAMRHSDGNLSTALVATGCDVKNEGKASVTTVHLKDPVYNIKVDLKYRAYNDVDMIEAWTEILNGEKGTVTLTTFASAMLPIRRGDVWMSHLSGTWAAEGQLSHEKLQPGEFVIRNNDGTRNSHTDHAEVMFSLDGKGQENAGNVIGAALVYSGNYKLKTVTDDTEYHYFFAGINEQNSEYHLKKGETFKTPALALTYSTQGLSGASRNFHKWGRKYILAHGDKERDILLNSWEGVYFDINQKGMDQMMADIHSMGGELFVMDDGWFGTKYPRVTDNCALGDWVVDTKKLPNGIEGLLNDARKNQVKFGIWIEPEMVSEKSELFKEHPDYAFVIPERKPVMGRSQLNLDFSRKEVVNCIFNQLTAVLDKIDVDYIKMDMNRSILNVYSMTEGIQNNGTILYKYVLGVYDFMERLQARYPKMFIEGCSGGGGRFDAGMMYYTPQIWCSDDTDAICRLDIQYGTSFGYPISVVGSHVSAVPNHQTGRTTPFNTRAVVAMAGSFGYELDLNKVSDEEKEEVKAQVENYKKYWDLLHNGLYYRLTDADKSKGVAAWSFVARDKSETLVNIVTVESFCNAPVPFVRVKGLDADATYVDEETGAEYSGQGLDQIGLPVPLKFGEYNAYQIHLVRK